MGIRLVDRLMVASLGLLVWSGCTSAAEQSENHFEITAESFYCIQEMTPVRGFFVDNLIDGALEATVAAATMETGTVYPAGSVVQLVPGEVMVKLPEGTSPATKDWEFFELDVSSGNTQITTRGFADVKNRFGGNCLACHAKAKPEFDMICETGHGCDPLPLSKEILKVIQKTDARCKNQQALTDEEKKLLMQLRQAFPQ